MEHVDPTEDRTARGAVYEAFADRNRSVESATERALAVGIDRLGVDVGFVTEIDDGQQTIVQAVGDHPGVRAGDSCPLDEAYCRRTIERDSPLAVQDAVASSEVSAAAYETFGLDTYVGVAVRVDGEIHGTVCFAGDEPRSEPFGEADQLFVELVARLLGQAIERRAHEERLEERNERLRAEKRRVERIADTSFDLLYEIDPDGTLTYVSSGIEAILGYGRAEATGTNFAAYADPESLDAALAAFEQNLAGQPVRNAELRLQRADGDTVVVETNGTPVFEDGEVVAVQGVARDVTERHEREAELRVKTRAIDGADVGVVIADATEADNPTRYVNDAFEELTGYGAGEMVGRNCRILQGERTDESATATLREAIDAAEPVSVELLNYRQDGTPFWNKVQVVPVEDDEGAVSNFVGFQEDITDRVRTNRLVELLNRVLRHNLRNELNVLRGYGDLLTDPGPAATDLDPGAVVDDTVADLLDLSDQVRELERIAREDRDPVRIDVQQLLAEAVSRVESEFPDARIDFTVDLPEGRGICAGTELTRALEELIENAVRHGADPSDPVSVTARAAGDEVEIVVGDEGPGIPAVEAAVVTNGHETAVEHGNGLGLWLVNWIVTRYGGSFQIGCPDDDEAASGTVAVVSLPGLDPDEDPDEVVRPHTTLFQ